MLPPSSPETGITRPSPEIEKLICEYRNQVVAPLNAWLASLENIRFDSEVVAKVEVHRILQTVRAAGCELLFANERVNLTVSIGTRQKAPSIRAVGRKDGHGVVLSSSIGFPKVRARPIDLPFKS